MKFNIGFRGKIASLMFDKVSYYYDHKLPAIELYYELMSLYESYLEELER